MANNLDLTDAEINHILEICAVQFSAPWSEGFQLLRAELQHFLTRGYSALESAQLAIIRSYGGSQGYIPRVKTFLLSPNTLNSRAFGEMGRHTRFHKIQNDDLDKLRDLSSKITAKQRDLDELKRKVSEQREILKQLRILTPKHLESTEQGATA